jgi:hypothetical protein
VKKYCEAAGIDPKRLGGRGIDLLPQEDGDKRCYKERATMHEGGSSPDMLISERLRSISCKEDDAEVATRQIQIRVTGRNGE